MVRPALVLAVVALVAPSAHARFGKKSPPPREEEKQSEQAQQEQQAQTSAPAPAPGRVHAASPVSYGDSYGDTSISSTRYAYARPRSCVTYAYVAPQVAPAPYVDEQAETQTESVGIRVMVGAEGQGFLGGANLGALAAFEGERWGVSFSGADIIVRADDGSNDIDQIGDFTAHLTFAFLTGSYGRLRAELGADAFFAPDIVMVGPTAGLSGVVWFGGSGLGLEGSVMVTAFPYLQLDAKAGLALGLGQWGLRAGWRVQALNDLGMVDGIAHGDVFNGPYVGVSFVF